jgi:hypothetical protein
VSAANLQLEGPATPASPGPARHGHGRTRRRRVEAWQFPSPVTARPGSLSVATPPSRPAGPGRRLRGPGRPGGHPAAPAVQTVEQRQARLSGSLGRHSESLGGRPAHSLSGLRLRAGPAARGSSLWQRFQVKLSLSGARGDTPGSESRGRRVITGMASPARLGDTLALPVPGHWHSGSDRDWPGRRAGPGNLLHPSPSPGSPSRRRLEPPGPGRQADRKAAALSKPETGLRPGSV